MSDSLPIPRARFDATVRSLDTLIEQVRVLGESIARELPDFARVERQAFERGLAPEAIQQIAKIVQFARDLQVAAVRIKVAAQNGSKALRECDPELTPVRSPSQAVMQAVRATQAFTGAVEALKK